MAAKKAGRIIHLANLPLRLLLPNSRENINEVAFKTVPSASKVRRSFSYSHNVVREVGMAQPLPRISCCVWPHGCQYLGF